MNFLADHYNLIKFLQWLNVTTATWPLGSDANILKRIFYAVLWYSYALNGITSILALSKGIYYYQDIVNMMKSIVEFVYICESLFNLCYCTLQKSNFKVLLIDDMKQFSFKATSQELTLRRNNLKNTSIFLAFMFTIFVSGGSIFVFAPSVLRNRDIPLNTIYPFPMEKSWTIYLVYILNTYTVMQAFCAISVDIMVIAILSYASFKFIILGMKLQNITSNDELKNFVMEHQDTIRYVTIIDYTVTPIVVKSIIAACTYLITCSLLLLNNVPFLHITQFAAVTILSFTRLLVCSCVAQAVTDIASNLISLITVSSWLESSSTMRKNILFIIQRCQKPITISVSGIVPALSLKFCGLVIYKTFSYIMTLRAILKV
ncbi:odorant receptor 49a-like isoform X1 [Vespula squamosa]|uniref:Odorant receptor n=1 Tax=Vespula squamosa TaxID=30214 RepID=A0ABD2AB80_VESSQ